MSALDDLERTLQTVRSMGRESVLESSLAELNGTLVSMLGRIEAQPQMDYAGTLEAFRSAVAGLRIDSPVSVMVDPTPVQVNVPQQAPPTVNVHPVLQPQSWQSLSIKKTTDQRGNTVFEVTKA